MIAGSLAVLETPADGPLEGYLHDAGVPALAVEHSQNDLDGNPIQTATAATEIRASRTDVHTGRNNATDSVYVNVDSHRTTEQVATDVVADPTGSGVVLAESVTDDGDPPFPFDLVWNVTEREPVPQRIAVDDLHAAWSRDDVLGDVWMTGADHGDGARIGYHDRADADDAPTIGLGFKRPWSGTAVKGCVYASGYTAIFSTDSASRAVRFVAEELLPYCSDKDDLDDDGQASVSDFGGDDA